MPRPVFLQGLLFNLASGKLKAPEKPAAMPFMGKCHLPLASLERMACGETAWGHILKGLASPQGGDMAQGGDFVPGDRVRSYPGLILFSLKTDVAPAENVAQCLKVDARKKVLLPPQ